MKKLSAIVMAMVMVMSLISGVFAVDAPLTESSLTTPDSSHLFNVYQIFTGDLTYGTNGAKVLSNVKYGVNSPSYSTATGADNSVPDTVIEALEALSSSSEVAKLNAIMTYVNMSSTPFIAKMEGKTTKTVPAGYYLLEDLGHTDGTIKDGEHYSLHLVQVAGPTSFEMKRSDTTSEKKVHDDDNNATYWEDSADYDIGDYVPFRISATITDRYNLFNHGYKLTFHDTMSEGLTFVNNDTHPLVVKVGDTVISSGYTVTTDTDDDCTFHVHFNNLKDIPQVSGGSTIAVEYYAQLNDSAKIGAEGNPNHSHITYTNNPNFRPTADDDGEKGKTPDDKVTVFTFQLNLTKYAEEIKPENLLKGAEFTLSKDGKVIKVIDGSATTTSDGSYSFSFSGLDAGVYVLTETKTPAGFNTMKPVTLTITAVHEPLADNPQLKELHVAPAKNVTIDVEAGTIDAAIINYGGTTLPSTGGMGTTIFYVTGAILVAGAGIILITKKRMGNM